MPEQNSHVVAHINKRFFAKSETFIYWYLKSFKNFHPLCLSLYPVVNADEFPFAIQDIYSLGNNSYTIKWLWYGIWRRIIGIQFNRLSFAKTFQERSVKLIHAHFGPTGWWSLVLKEKLGIPLITTFYGYDLAPNILNESLWWPKQRTELFLKGDLFLVEGPFMRQTLIKLGCPENKVQIQPIAIPIQKILFRRMQRKNNQPMKILFAGRFIEKKGLLDALQAVAHLKQLGKNVEFRLIGDGVLMPSVQHFIKNNGLENTIFCLGFRKYDEYIQELERSDVFLHPSVKTKSGDTEGGAPTTILEAQAAGLPIVSTKHADIPFVTKPGVSAILVPEHDVQSLTESLLFLVDNPEKWFEMGVEGRKHVEENHDIKSQAPVLEKKYTNLIKDKEGICVP